MRLDNRPNMIIGRLLAIMAILFNLLLPLTAQAASAKTAQVTRVAVVPLHAPKGDVGKTENAADEIRKALTGNSGVYLLPRSETDATLASRPELTGRGGATLGSEVRRAFDEYFTLSLEQSLSRIKRALAEIDSRGYLQAGDFDIVGAYIIQGMDLLALDERRAAVISFKEAARLDPDRILSEADFSPTVRQVFAEARAELEKTGKQGWLVIGSQPMGGQITVNGVAKGKTPYVVKEFPVGKHFVTVLKNGFEPFHEVVEVTVDEPHEVIAKPAKISGKNVAAKYPDADLGAGPAVADLTDVATQSDLGVGLGKVMTVDKVVFVSTENLGWGWRVTARVVDVSTGQANRMRQVEVTELPEEAANAGNILAQFATSGSEGTTASETIALAKPVKKKFYQKPAFWVGVGVAAIGAGVGTGMALTSSGSGTASALSGSSDGPLASASAGGAGGTSVSLEIPGNPK